MELRVSDLGFGAHGLRFRFSIQGLGIRVQGLWFTIQGSGFRV